FLARNSIPFSNFGQSCLACFGKRYWRSFCVGIIERSVFSRSSIFLEEKPAYHMRYVASSVGFAFGARSATASWPGASDPPTTIETTSDNKKKMRMEQAFR